MTDLTARAYHDHAHAAPIGRVTLDYEGRFLRRRVIRLDDGRALLVDLAQTTSLAAGGVLLTEAGEITIAAAPEPLLEIRGGDLVRLAWHIGNRHTPCQIEAHRLLIQRDHVMADLLARLGAETRAVEEPFTPEGGAYGHGRTHGHDHSHAHGPGDHAHA
ncbi:urease accessory protein UreE [Roseivivax sp. GX 12232]|uniref:urease accessory protein UreE n=1 Tax=Roseivivax sp. GX 12232 TaxID=2900547 RepID=UPI001E5C020F|nr:urease accessory protein UreE [Roseivivax sp. GX 12232]MCE0505788.1 urease accessory protein UreE [Roseivivax sp. GX 12232]